jgi:outer membrane protein assembly factor BamD (BamD/ComL family)
LPEYVEAPYEASAWASPSSAAADDDEEEARKLLVQARQHVQGGDKQRAVALLQEIIRRFPRTETADQARRNLQKRGL